MKGSVSSHPSPLLQADHQFNPTGAKTMNTHERQSIGAQLCASIHRLFSLLMGSIHRRLLTNKLNGLVRLGDDCIRSGLGQGDPALSRLFKEATTLCDEYSIAKGVDAQSMVFTLPALTRLQSLASPQASKGFGRFLATILAVVGGAILTG